MTSDELIRNPRNVARMESATTRRNVARMESATTRRNVARMESVTIWREHGAHGIHIGKRCVNFTLKWGERPLSS